LEHTVGEGAAAPAWATLRRGARLGAAVAFALAGGPAQAQQRNFYGTASQFFHVPFTAPVGSEQSSARYVALSLPLNGTLTRMR
jgi:hypothetical protein